MIATQSDVVLVIAFGSDVVCNDDYIGHVHRLVVDPASKRVIGLVVEHGLLHHRVVVPITHVERIADKVAGLDIDKHQLAALPPYTAVDFSQPDPGWTGRHGAVQEDAMAGRYTYGPWGLPAGAETPNVVIRTHLHTGIPEPLIALGRGTRVSCSSGLVGHLEQVMLEPATHTISALVVRGGHLRPSETQMPASRIIAMTEREIYVEDDRYEH
jgi:uncharacterized protein YrrD